jgi:hypothetical protein
MSLSLLSSLDQQPFYRACHQGFERLERILIAKIMLLLTALKQDQQAYQRHWSFIMSFLDQGQASLLEEQAELLADDFAGSKLDTTACHERLIQLALEFKASFGQRQIPYAEAWTEKPALLRFFSVLILFSLTDESNEIQGEIKKLALVFEFDQQRLYLLQEQITQSLYLQALSIKAT